MTVLRAPVLTHRDMFFEVLSRQVTGFRLSQAEISLDVYLLTAATFLSLPKFIYYLNGFNAITLEKRF